MGCVGNVGGRNGNGRFFDERRMGRPSLRLYQRRRQENKDSVNIVDYGKLFPINQSGGVNFPS